MLLVINLDRSLVHLTEHSRGDSVFAICFESFSPIKDCNAELGCELVRGRNVSRYEQFESNNNIYKFKKVA